MFCTTKDEVKVAVRKGWMAQGAVIRGRDLPVYVDTFDLAPDYEQERVHEVLRGRVRGCW
jgi:hypothetical protein